MWDRTSGAMCAPYRSIFKRQVTRVGTANAQTRKTTSRLDFVWRVVATGSLLLLSHRTTIAPRVRATLVSEASMDVEALDQRISAALQLFERLDPTAGEAELREMAEHYPSYAPALFYLGLLSQKKGVPEVAAEFYAAALHAGICCCSNWRLMLL